MTEHELHSPETINPETINPETFTPDSIYPEKPYDIKSAKKTFSKVGWVLALFMAAIMISQTLCAVIIIQVFGRDHWLLTTSWGMWISNYLPFYAIAVPCALLAFRKLPKDPPARKKLSFKDFVVFFLIGYFFIYAGNIIGTVTSMIFSGGAAENPVVNLAMDNNPLKILVVVILAPVFEELIFRKKLIDCTKVYGEKTAVLLSGFVFGLYHMNLFQFFYAFALGLIFGYIYLKTGRIRYTMIMHGIVNFIGSVLAPFILSQIDLETLSQATNEELFTLLTQNPNILIGILLYMLFSVCIFGICIAGFVLFLVYRSRLVWKKTSKELPKGKRFRTVYVNAGMIVYFLICIFMIVMML